MNEEEEQVAVFCPPAVTAIVLVMFYFPPNASPPGASLSPGEAGQEGDTGMKIRILLADHHALIAGPVAVASHASR